MLKDKITKMTGGGIARKFIIWTVVIIMLLDALVVVVMEVDLRRSSSEDLNDRGRLYQNIYRWKLAILGICLMRRQ